MQTKTAERLELHKQIDALPEEIVIDMLNFIRGFQPNAEAYDWVDPIEIGTWNTETLETIRDVEKGKVERFESKEELFKGLKLC